MSKAKIQWTDRAELDLQRIRQGIAKSAPRTATAYVKKLRRAVDLLRNFPELGGICEELPGFGCREIVKGNYRIIYRVLGNVVQIINVRHAARLLGEDFLDE